MRTRARPQAERQGLYHTTPRPTQMSSIQYPINTLYAGTCHSYIEFINQHQSAAHPIIMH